MSGLVAPTSEPCPYEGRFKACSPDHVSKLYCRGHVDDWVRLLPHYDHVVMPRKFPADAPDLPCEGDWMLPGMVP